MDILSALINAIRLKDPRDVQRYQTSYHNVETANDRQYWRRYWNAARWCMLLLVGFGYSRIFCYFGLPKDAVHHTYLGQVVSLSHMLTLGIVQAWFCEILDDNHRCDRIFENKYFYALFFVSMPVFIVIGSLAPLQRSINTDSDSLENPYFAIVVVFVSIIIFLTVSWHAWYASQVLSCKSDVAGYLLGRLCVVAFLVIALLAAISDPTPLTFHLHHYFSMWLLSMVACFHHPISVSVLAMSTSIFIQGISAYSAASIIFRPGDPSEGPKFIH